MKKLVVGIACMMLLAPASFTQTNQSGQQKRTTKEQREAEKKGKREVEAKHKADEKQAKEAAKRERKLADINRKAYLRTPAEISSSASAEVVGTVLTRHMASRGYNLTEYQPPQIVFGNQTPYKAVYSAPLTGGLDVSWRVSFHLKYGTSSDPYSIIYIEILESPTGSLIAGKIGVAANTIRGLAFEDLTSNDFWRSTLDSIMNQVKRSAETP